MAKDKKNQNYFNLPRNTESIALFPFVKENFLGFREGRSDENAYFFPSEL